MDRQPAENYAPSMIKIAAQLYTVREYTQTATDLAATLKKVSQIGYSAVQISAIGLIPDSDVGRMLEDNQLSCCATHSTLERMKSEPQKLTQLPQLPPENIFFGAAIGHGAESVVHIHAKVNVV